MGLIVPVYQKNLLLLHPGYKGFIMVTRGKMFLNHLFLCVFVCGCVLVLAGCGGAQPETIKVETVIVAREAEVEKSADPTPKIVDTPSEISIEVLATSEAETIYATATADAEKINAAIEAEVKQATATAGVAVLRATATAEAIALRITATAYLELIRAESTSPIPTPEDINRETANATNEISVILRMLGCSGAVLLLVIGTAYFYFKK